MDFPAPDWYFPTKDEMADYLEAYAARFELPVQLGVRVDRLAREGERFLVTAGERRFEADNVVVAMSNWQKPSLPPFEQELDPGIVQMHSSEYKNPAQLRDGGVLIVGAGNSGAEIALDVAHSHSVWLSGRDTGHVPFRIGGLAYRLFLARLVGQVLFHRVLTVNTPIGRKLRPKLLSKGHPLVRIKPKDLAAAGIQRVPRTAGVQDGLPMLKGGRVLDVANIIWCTGFRPSFSWINLPIFGGKENPREPVHNRGIVPGEPGLYFVGLTFLFAASSSTILGVGRDAEYVVKAIQARQQHSLQKEGADFLSQPDARPRIPSPG
jgi:putative flavoprotein involved in K+ transport